MRTGGERSLPWPGRLILCALFVVGAVLATPSGFGVFWFVPYAGVGTLLAIRRPRTSIGWLLIGLGWCFAIATNPAAGTPEQIAAGGLDPLSAGIDVLTSMAGAVAFYLFGVLAIVFPSGRLPIGRWRGVAVIALAVGLAALVASAVMPTISLSWQETSGVPVRNPWSILPDLPIWHVLTPDSVILPIVALMIGAAVSLFVRFRRALGVERQQLRWITAALAFVVIAVLGGFILGLVVPTAADAGVIWLGAVVAFPLVPLAIGIAVLRYRLFEIDRIISRTIAWAALTGVLFATFVGPVLVLQAILAPLTGGNTVAVAASTLIVAALFQPLRRRVQTVVDRRFDRARYDGQRTAAAFAERLRDEVDTSTAITDLEATIRVVLSPSTIGLWLRGSHE